MGLFGLNWGMQKKLRKKKAAGYDIPWWHYVTPWEDKKTYIGEYSGKDDTYGSEKYMEEMIQKGTEGLSQFLEGAGQGGTPKGKFGFGKALKDAGIEYSFDPTDIDSFAKALGLARFEQETLADIQDVGSDVYTEEYATKEAGDSFAGYAALGESGAERLFQDWWEGKDDEEGRAADFRSMANMHVLNPYQAAQLDPEHSRWQDMLNPALAEATDVYREDIGNIFGRLGGDIRTGSALKRRQEAIEGYGSNVLSAKEGVQSSQSEYQQRTLQDIINAFQS